jgi:outer membrane protein TolC
MTNETSWTSRTRSRMLDAAFILTSTAVAWGQSLNPLGYSVTTPRPISPAEGTTTPSAQATQRQNPYLGSVPSKNTGTRIDLSLRGAIERGLRYNLGLFESNQASADVRAERLRALSALLPQLSANARQGYENFSFKEIGIKTPASVSHNLFIMVSFEAGIVLGRATSRRQRSASRIHAT